MCVWSRENRQLRLFVYGVCALLAFIFTFVFNL
jgi:hypothetical protein